MKLDETDRRLVFLLDRDARAPLTELSEQLGLSREAVNYRMRKLRSSGTIRSFLTKFNFSRLGFVNYTVFMKLHNLDAAECREFISELAEVKKITWLASLGGRFDLVAEFASGTPESFDGHFSPLLEKYSEKISSHQVSTRVSQHIFGKKYLWPEKMAAEGVRVLPFNGPERPQVIDSLDQDIISAISSNARVPLSTLSKKIKHPPSTVSFRLKQLEQRGIIEGYTTFSRMQDFGYFRFKALMALRDFSKEKADKFLMFCHAHPSIYYYAKALGNWNFEMEVDAKSPMEYQQFLIDFRSKFGGLIQEIESLSILEEHKFCFWPE